MKNGFGFFRNGLKTSFLSIICIGILILIVFMFKANAYSAEVTLAWNANSASDLAGYNVYYGTSKTNYTYCIDVVNSTSCNISGLQEGRTYYFAATAVSSNGDESGFSNQVSSYIPVSSPSSSPNDVVYRINAGGPAVTAGGMAWSKDKLYSGSSSTYKKVVSIAGTSLDVLYQTERYGRDFNYNLPVQPGVYMVKLHFAEIYFSTTRSRIFDVDVEKGQFSLNGFDIVADAGAKEAVVKTINNIRVTDGTLNINFDASKDNGKLSAIEVILISADI